MIYIEYLKTFPLFTPIGNYLTLTTRVVENACNTHINFDNILAMGNDKKFATMSTSISLPEPVRMAAQREAQERGLSVSRVLSERLAVAYGFSYASFINNTRNRKPTILQTASIQLEQKDLPWPRHFNDIFNSPNRSKLQYQELLREDSRYINPTAKEEADAFRKMLIDDNINFTGPINEDTNPLISDSDKAIIRDLMERYAY